MKVINYNIKIFLLPFLILIAFTAKAQTTRPDSRFKKGEEFERQTVVKSNCALQRGGQTLNISTYSAVTKLYKVNDVVNKLANINITITKIIDTINALGHKVVYNSDNKPDPQSDTQMTLFHMLGKPAVVSVDEAGKIVTAPKQLPGSDTQLWFVGIQPEFFMAGSTVDFILDFPSNPFLKKGYTWTDNTPSVTTTYTINAVTGRTTTITYSSTDLEGNLNSRTNGVLLIDNESGIVVKRSTQSVTTGYEVIKGVVYTAIRRTATSEVCYKKEDAQK